MKKKLIFICGKGYLGNFFIAEYSSRFSGIQYSNRSEKEGLSYRLGENLNQALLQAMLESHHFIFCIPPSIDEFDIKFSHLIDTLVSQKFAGQFIFISSTSVFNDKQSIVNELDQPIASSLNGQKLLSCEKYLNGQKSLRSLVIRPAGIIGPGRHPANFFKDNILSTPLAALNLIHIKDLSKIIMSCIELDLTNEIIHAVQPTNLNKGQFYQLARSKVKGPNLTLINNESGEHKKILSVNLSKLLNYEYEYPTIEECLNHL